MGGRSKKSLGKGEKKEYLPCDRYYAKYFHINPHEYLITDDTGKGVYYYSLKALNQLKKIGPRLQSTQVGNVGLKPRSSSKSSLSPPNRLAVAWRQGRTELIWGMWTESIQWASA